MNEHIKPTRNVYEIRQKRIARGWMDEFAAVKRRRILPLILLIALIGLEVAHWLIF